MESPLSAIKKFAVGSVIGIASTVPGVSGAVLAVCFGVYERLVADIADLRHRLKKDFWFILIIGLGILFGMFLSAFGLDFIFENYRMISVLLFAGLIIGQLPELWTQTDTSVKPKSTNYLALIVGLIIMGSFLIMGTSESKVIGHDITSILYMVLVGVIFSVSKLAPGISGATILLAIGLFEPLMKVMTNFDIILLIPLGIGILIGLVVFSKVVNYALNHYRKSTYFMIFGLTIGSIFVMLGDAVNHYVGGTELAVGIVCFIVGIVLSILFTKIGKSTKEEFATIE